MVWNLCIAMWSQELYLMILVGLYQLKIFFDYIVLRNWNVKYMPLEASPRIVVDMYRGHIYVRSKYIYIFQLSRKWKKVFNRWRQKVLKNDVQKYTVLTGSRDLDKKSTMNTLNWEQIIWTAYKKKEERDRSQENDGIVMVKIKSRFLNNLKAKKNPHRIETWRKERR